ncbi:cyclic nucleotide-gated cation channel beta-1-like [Salarias fasciatus]|uniref:cyclic nucleotide-gated cation channel beta-1-like n=1 Tax=Salarias fasciatus TaxID=181472 RepID=UPI001176D37B|nr:cyclic nucleotide-gated cation channel beta-1-like [Salarias fasciatus]
MAVFPECFLPVHGGGLAVPHPAVRWRLTAGRLRARPPSNGVVDLPESSPAKDAGLKLREALKQQLAAIHERVEAKKLARLALAEVRQLLAREEEDRELELGRKEISARVKERVAARLKEEEERMEKEQVEKALEKLRKEKTKEPEKKEEEEEEEEEEEDGDAKSKKGGEKAEKKGDGKKEQEEHRRKKHRAERSERAERKERKK